MPQLIGLLVITGIIALASPIAAFWFISVTLVIGYFISEWQDSDFAQNIRDNKAAYRKAGQKPPSYAGGFYVVLAIIIFTAICGIVSPQDLEHGNRPLVRVEKRCDTSVRNYYCGSIWPH
jgi:hypothetical protein